MGDSVTHMCHARRGMPVVYGGRPYRSFLRPETLLRTARMQRWRLRCDPRSSAVIIRKCLRKIIYVIASEMKCSEAISKTLRLLPKCFAPLAADKYIFNFAQLLMLQFHDIFLLGNPLTTNI